jgi:DNA-binding transcriptional MerR regulator
MNYTINQLAEIAHLSTRTLRYYDQIGLLKAKRDSQSNYRLYSTDEVNKLQQILFYRELGFELKDIKKVLDKKDAFLTEKLKLHIEKLKAEQNRIQKLIENVEKTLLHQKGVIYMSDQEKFEGFKHQLLKDNDEMYKDEVINKWGNDAYETSRKAFKNMTKVAYDAFQDLAKEIISELLVAFQEGNDPKSTHALSAAKLHQTWIKTAWGSYNTEAHLNLVDMYVADDRFKAYYDSHQEGLAKLLRDSVYYLIIENA